MHDARPRQQSDNLAAQWTVGYIRGVPVATLLDANAICECVHKKFDRFVIVASHMRYKFDYLMTYCLGERAMDKIERKHGTFSMNNTYFYMTSYSQHLVSLWDNTLQKLNLTRKSIVLFQTGAHDVTRRGASKAMGPDFDDYLKALVDIKLRANKVGFKMVIITSPPFPDHSPTVRRGHRNNYAMAALSRLLHD